MAKKAKKEELKFYQKLVLNRYLLKVFGAKKFEDLAKCINSPLYDNIRQDGDTGFYQQLITWFHDKMLVSKEQLQQYDLNIVSHLNKINRKRTDKIKLKYFQYLSLLFVEYYLDMFFHHKDQLLDDLNQYLADFKEQYSDASNIKEYQADDLNKIALWNATGSGKTLLMHINYYQYMHYAGAIGEGDTYILLTPKEGLSKQHLIDFAESGIPAESYNKNYSKSFISDPNTIEIIENTKLAEKDGDKTVAVSRFGTHNVVFVDEGHRGASGDTWYLYRNELCKDGFSFEYSATFGQAVAASKDKNLESEYEKCIIFDYSYKYFYADGFGKDYYIINLEDDTNLDVSGIYLAACLLTYYQQKKLYLEKGNEFKSFKVENPLMIFVGSSVNAVNVVQGKSTSDVVDILLFIKRFVENDSGESVNFIKRILEHKTGLLDKQNRDVFWNTFGYLTDLSMSPEAMFADVMKVVFNCNTNSSLLHVENMRGIDGEISLRLGENEPFGLINVGDDSKLMSLCESTGFKTESIDFKESLFDHITESDSKINILIGSKKFTEGWNCWRVSTMGLMNVGKSEGSEIIQLFGRGVRLKGYNFSLMRSNEYDRTHPNEHITVPKYIPILETINVFGVKADYMRKFREYLEKEGVSADKDEPYVISMPVIRNRKFRNKKLYSLQIKEGLDYKKDAKKPVLEYKPGYVVDLDCYGKIQFETSRTTVSSETQKEQHSLLPKHLAMLDIDDLCLEMETYKAQKLRYNLIITRAGIQSLLDARDWYRLSIPSGELEIHSYADYQKFRNIFVALLKLYCDRLYNSSRNAWESNYMEYKPVDSSYENFIDGDEYEITVNDPSNNAELISFVESLKKEVEEAKAKGQLVDFSQGRRKGDFEAISFSNSLYNPLLYVNNKAKEIVVYPVALVDSEKDFIMGLDNYLKSHTEQFSGKDVYLIRNKAKKGVGFFETAGFYPDFILWLVDGEKEYITFIEPHGMVHEEIGGEKVALHTKIKAVQTKLADPNVILNSVILTESTVTDLIDSHTEEEWNDNNVFFMDDSNYLDKLFAAMK